MAKCWLDVLLSSPSLPHHSSPSLPHVSAPSLPWLKLFVDETPRAHGVDWDAVVFGNGSRSICGGGGGPMYECRMDRGH